MKNIKLKHYQERRNAMSEVKEAREGKSRAYLGTKKYAPKTFKSSEGMQYCIDGVYVDEVLKGLPDNIKIIGGQVRIGTAWKRTKEVVPVALRRLGCTYFTKLHPSSEANITFDQISKTAIKENVKKACKLIDADYKKAHFRYITLTNGESNGRFERTTKELHPDERDLRKKATVLGLKDATGKIQGLIADISANKYFCRKQTVEVTTVICSKE